jgi:hypothetical protein
MAAGFFIKALPRDNPIKCKFYGEGMEGPPIYSNSDCVVSSARRMELTKITTM